jgi:alpha-ketoglutarate-dependent taurine dioxygenase
MRVVQISEQFGSTIEGSPEEKLANIDPNTVRNLIKDRGVVMFTGFDAPLAEFDMFIRQFGDDFMNYKGGGTVRRKVTEDQTLLSTRFDYGREQQDTFGLPLHGEMYYTKTRPVLLWFYCDKPAASDGETTVCDGAQIYDALSNDSKDLLAKKKLKYLRRYRDGEWQLVYQTDNLDESVKFCKANGISAHADDDRVLATEYVHPAVIKSRWGEHLAYINSALLVYWQEEELGRTSSIVRLEDGSKLPRQLVDEVIAAQKRLIIPMVWKHGDFAVLDNTRTMHGRRPFTDPNREIYLRMVRDVAF